MINTITDNNFTYSALQSIHFNNLDKDFIIKIIINIIPKNFNKNKLLFEYQNYSILTNLNFDKILSIRFFFNHNYNEYLRSIISQPSITHPINWKTEGCALQRTDVDSYFWEEVDCARCAMSYAGIGTVYSRSLLQIKCVIDYGITHYDLNNWLFNYAKRPKNISLIDWKKLAPRFYSINRNFVKKLNGFANASFEIANLLLQREESCVASWSRYKSNGHFFNIAKIKSSNIPWYVCAQSYTNPGIISLFDQIIQIEYQFSGINYLNDISFLLTPYQASQLFDDEEIPMLFI